MSINNNRKKCTRCKVNLPSDSFSVKRADILYKHCDRCREMSKKNKCPHRKQKSKCKECGGSSICEHNKIKCYCKECGGSQICEHNNRKSQCKECGGSQICEHKLQKHRCRDCGGTSLCGHNRIKSMCKECMTHKERIEYIIKNMVKNSRRCDIEKDRYDANNFIDKCFLEGLFEDSDKCHYCDIPFTYTEKKGTFVSIERLDNKIGHIKSNCVIACLGCNLRHNY